MALLTTTIGSYPKPDYVPVTDWFRTDNMSLPRPAEVTASHAKTPTSEMEVLFARAAQEVVREQVELGIDVPTDGEVRRENYIHYHCRRLKGIDFQHWAERRMRGGSWQAEVPTIVGRVEVGQRGFLVHDWRVAQAATDRPVKVTVPGPMTISDTLADDHYGDNRRLGTDLARAINVEVRLLAAAGCRWIQVDEPVFAVYPDRALAYGIDNLERCFSGVQKDVIRTLHMCCGYPAAVDLDDYPKADPSAYHQLADAIDASTIEAVSIEDAHRHNDLALLERFRTSTVILGVIAIARTRVESVEGITSRLREALQHIDAGRLMAAPDCGLGMLERPTIRKKLANLAAAARHATAS